jgi:hypothetical protein
VIKKNALKDWTERKTYTKLFSQIRASGFDRVNELNKLVSGKKNVNKCWPVVVLIKENGGENFENVFGGRKDDLYLTLKLLVA